VRPPPTEPAISSTASATNDYARVDWRYPFGILTTSFVLMGVSAFFRILPLSTEHANILTLAVLVAWRYGVHWANIFPWDWRGSWTHSFLQCVLNAAACFVFFMAVRSWLAKRLTLTDALVPLIACLFVLLFEVRSKNPNASPRPHISSS
jgi:hypothetical protein